MALGKRKSKLNFDSLGIAARLSELFHTEERIIFVLKGFGELNFSDHGINRLVTFDQNAFKEEVYVICFGCSVPVSTVLIFLYQSLFGIQTIKNPSNTS